MTGFLVAVACLAFILTISLKTKSWDKITYAK
jgi:hypothetical protein